MLARILSTHPAAAVLLTAALAASPWACGSSDSVPQEYEELGGSGGALDGAGGSGAKTSSSGSHASSSSSSSSSSKAASSSHSSASAGGAGGSGGSGGSMCDDTGVEPNEDEGSATDLGTFTDCDLNGSQTQGVLAGPTDVDWFKYFGDDTFGCTVDPGRGITIVGTARLCKFIDCVTPPALITCPMGTTTATSPSGLPGCCGSDDFQESVDCGDSDDDATVYIRLDQATDDCAKYTLTFHY